MTFYYKENNNNKKLKENTANELNLTLYQTNKEIYNDINIVKETRNLSPQKLSLKEDNSQDIINEYILDDSMQNPRKNEQVKSKSKNKKWNKLFNLILGLNTFKKMETKPIKNNESIDYELKTFEKKCKLKCKKETQNNTFNNQTNNETKKEMDKEFIHELALQILIKYDINCFLN